MQVLVLNASYEVLNVTRWQRAVGLIFSGKAEVLEESDMLIHSINDSIPMPSVIRMVYHVRKPRLLVPFSRTNLFMRDRYCCQYCGAKKTAFELTMDHVIPRARGGETSWENVVTACRPCNAHKGDRTPDQAGIKLIKKPRTPHYSPNINSSYRNEWSKYVPFIIPQAEEVH